MKLEPAQWFVTVREGDSKGCPSYADFPSHDEAIAFAVLERLKGNVVTGIGRVYIGNCGPVRVLEHQTGETK